MTQVREAMHRRAPAVGKQSKPMENSGAVILAAGLSERMGRPKPLLRYDEKKNFLEHIVQVYTDAGCSYLSVVVNDRFAGMCLNAAGPWRARYRVVVNKRPEDGRFYSVLLGLRQLPEVDHCFIQNIDNPFIDVELLKRMYDEKTLTGCVIPVFENRRGHPVLIGRQAIRYIRDHGKSANNLREILECFPAKELAVPDGRPLININTPADYLRHFGCLPTVSLP